MPVALDRGLVGALVDGMVHEARNPLNAFSLHLEVLTEKLKQDGGGALSTLHLCTMRQQIRRMDDTLSQFAEFLAPRCVSETSLNLSAIVTRAVGVVGHAARLGNVELRTQIEPGRFVRSEDSPAIHALVLRPLLRCVNSSPGSTVQVGLTGSGTHVEYSLHGLGAFFATDELVLAEVVRAHGGQWRGLYGEMWVRLPGLSGGTS